MNTVEQKTELPYYAFDIDFLQPSKNAPHTYAVFSYQKPAKRYNHITKEYYDVMNTQYVWRELDDYYKVLEGVFTTKAEYLAWRKKWKVAYKELSQMIRHAKNNRKKDFKDRKYKQYQWQQRTNIGGQIARRMMMLLTAAKDLSWQLKVKSQIAEAEVIAL